MKVNRQQIAVIDYNAGNVQSVLFALRGLGVDAVLTRHHDTIRQADKVIFPGVGEAATTMQFLRQQGLDTVIPALTQPVLGICLGLQLLCLHSEEKDTNCLGVWPIRVKRFEAYDPSYKIPHMGWNQLEIQKGGWLPHSLDKKYVYFVHSYYAEVHPYTVARCFYAQPFSAIIQHQNFYATQFHVEKSGPVGLEILNAFLEIGTN
jgi:imidazole glycerol-phosphate synthase subunit HisH